MAIPSTLDFEFHSFIKLIVVFLRFLILAVVMDTVLYLKKDCAMETVLKVRAFWCYAA
jgi:hypothetical protein